MRHELVAEHVEIDPRLGAAAFGEAHFVPVELAGFIDIADLDGEVEGGDWHVDPQRVL